MGISNIPDWVKILMLKGEKGDPGGTPTMSEEPIDNGNRITIVNADGTTSTFDLHNATSGDYSGLTNKPSINNVLVSGDKTGGDYNLANASDVYTKTEVYNKSEVYSKGDYIILDYSEQIYTAGVNMEIAHQVNLANYGITDVDEVVVVSMMMGYQDGESTTGDHDWTSPAKYYEWTASGQSMKGSYPYADLYNQIFSTPRPCIKMRGFATRTGLFRLRAVLLKVG